MLLSQHEHAQSATTERTEASTSDKGLLSSIKISNKEKHENQPVESTAPSTEWIRPEIIILQNRVSVKAHGCD